MKVTAIDAQQFATEPQLAGRAWPPGFRLSVVIPVYNERDTVAEVVRRVRRSGVPCQIILVDDGSTDGSRELLESWRDQDDLAIILQPRNRGKGAALKAGFAAAEGDVVIVQDADLEYDPADYARLIQPIVDGEADVVFGSRYFSGRRPAGSRLQYLANRLLTRASNLFTGLRLSDMETCYKAFRGETIRALAPTLCEERFGIEPELTAKVARLPGVRVVERPVSYTGRTRAEGKKITWRDGVQSLWCIVRYRRGTD